MKKEYKTPFIVISLNLESDIANLEYSASAAHEDAIPLPGGPADDNW